MSIKLIACPSCACHAMPDATECPHCGVVLRQTDGTVQRTAIAALMGLSMAASSCVVVYGPGPTGGTGGDGGGSTDTSSSSSSSSGQGGMGGMGGMGGKGGAGGSAGQAGMGGAGGSGGK